MNPIEQAILRSETKMSYLKTRHAIENTIMELTHNIQHSTLQLNQQRENLKILDEDASEILDAILQD